MGKKNVTGQIAWNSASRCVAMVRGKNGTNPAVGGGSNGLRGYKLLRLPMVAGSPITRTGDEREISQKKHEIKGSSRIFTTEGAEKTWKRLEETAKTSKCQQRPHPSRWMVNGPSVPQSYAIPVERWALFGCFFFSRRRTLLVKKHEARDPAEKDRSFFWGKLRQCASSCVSKEAEKEPCANKQDHHNDHHYYHHLNLSLPKSTFWIFKNHPAFTTTLDFSAARKVLQEHSS